MPINPEIYQPSGEKGKRRMIQKECSSVSAPSDIILPATVNTPGHFPIPKAHCMTYFQSPVLRQVELSHTNKDWLKEIMKKDAIFAEIEALHLP
jgi:Ni,Fe-hydrogenase III small subunit